MKYAVTYYQTFRYYDKVDEVVFHYSGKGDLLDIINKTIPKQEQLAIVNIAFKNADIKIDDVLPAFLMLKRDHPNFIVAINLYTQKDFIDILKENEIDFMFANYANEFSMVKAMFLLGAKQIYLTEDICFSLPLLQEYRKKGMKFRIFPDVAQAPRGCGNILPELSNFFIRPEDVSLYEKLVDTMEIFRSDERCSVVFEIYKQEQWKGPLSALIMDVNTDISNSAIVPYFGSQRTSCKKRCNYGKCDICEGILNLGESLNEAGIGLIKEKKEFYTQQEKDEMYKAFEQRIKEHESQIN